MRETINWLWNGTDGVEWMNEPLWDILMATGTRYVQITPESPLWDYLDHSSFSTASDRNYLMWEGNVWADDMIKITHFGPLGKGKRDNLNELFRNLKTTFTSDMSEKFPNKKAIDKMDEDKREDFEDSIREYVRGNYLKIKEELQHKIDDYTADLKDVITQIFGTLEEGLYVTEMLAKGLGPTAFKVALKQASKMVLKEIAKEIAKISAKQSGKSFAKKIPFVGAAVGVGFGVVRLIQGDPGRAAMEVASGAASCVPGAGTAASATIDVAIAGLDIKEAVDGWNAKQTHFEMLRDSLNTMLSNMEKLLKAYEVIADAQFEEFNFDDDFDDLMKAVAILSKKYWTVEYE